MARKTKTASPPVEHRQHTNGESKAEKFKRVAAPRVRRTLEHMSRLHNVTNRATYEFTDDEATKIIDALLDGVNKLQIAFQGKKVVTHFEL